MLLLIYWLMMRWGRDGSWSWSIVVNCCNLSVSEVEVGTSFLNLFFLYLSGLIIFTFQFKYLNNKLKQQIIIQLAGNYRCCIEILFRFGVINRLAWLLLTLCVFCHLICWFGSGTIACCGRILSSCGCSILTLNCLSIWPQLKLGFSSITAFPHSFLRDSIWKACSIS